MRVFIKLFAMSKKTLALGLIFVFFLNMAMRGQENSWSLDDCISYALENNIQLKREQLSAKTSQNNYLNSKLQVLPSLNGFSNANYHWGKTFSYDELAYVDQNYMDFSFGVQASIELFNGLQKLNTIQQNKYNVLSSLESVEAIKNEITLNIAATFLQILLNKELLTLAREQHEVTRLQVVRAEKLVEVGNEAKGSLLEMQAQEALEKSNVINVSNNLKISILTLAQLLNLDSIGSFDVEIPEILEVDENLVLISPESIFTEAELFMPFVKSAEYGLKSQKEGLSIARGTRYPSLLMRFTEFSRYNELAGLPGVDEYLFKDQISDFENKQLSLQLNIPIFNNWNVQNRISNAKVAFEDSKLYLDLAKQTLHENIQQAHANAAAALENYFAMKESVNSNQEAFTYSEERFNVGMLNSVDYNLAKNNLTRAQSDFLQAKYDYIFKTKILDFYQGIELKL